MFRAIEATKDAPAQGAGLASYIEAAANVRYLATQVTVDPVRAAVDRVSVSAALVASASDPSARRRLLDETFAAIDSAESAIGPELRKQIVAGYVKSDEA